MSNKEIRIKWLSDESEIDKSVQKLQQKLVQMNRSSAQMQNLTETGGTLSPNALRAKGAFESSQRAILERERRELDVSQRKEMQFLSQKEKALEKIKAIEGELSKKQQQKLKSLELEVNMSAKKAMDIETTKRQIDDTLNQGKPPTPPEGSGTAGGGGLGGIMSKIARSLDPMKIAGAMVGSARMYGQYLSHEQTREREVQGYRGAQTQAQNLGFQDTMSGQGFMRFYEGGERSQALKMAMDERRSRLSGDPMRAAASIGGQALAGGIGGGMMGGPLGAAGGAALGAGNAIFGNKGIYRQIFDREAYTADVNAQTMQNYKGNLANLRMQDPGKYAAMTQFGKRAGQMQKTQRRLGFSDEEMFGGGFLDDENYDTTRRRHQGAGAGKRIRGQSGLAYNYESDEVYEKRLQDMRNQSATNAGVNANRAMSWMERNQTDRSGNRAFTEERINQNMNNIFSAGGSTGFVRGGGAGMAAEYQRAGFGNAAGELGSLSGLGGSTEQTEQSYVKLLAEGVKLGFNASNPSEEMRKFTAIATQMFVATGGSEGAVRTFGQGVVGSSMASIKAGQSVFGQLNQEAGQSTGYRGALKQSYLQSQAGQDAFGKVDEDTKQMLTEMGLNNLDPDDPIVQKAARQQGVSPEQMVKNLRGMQRFGENLSGDTDKKRGAFQDAYKKFRGDRKDTGDLKQEFMKGEGADAFTDYLTAYGIEREGIGSKTSYEKFALGGAGLGGDLTGLKDKVGGIDLGGKGRVLDTQEASKAADQIGQMSIIASHLDTLNKAFKENSTASLSLLRQIIKADDMQTFIDQLEKSDKELAATIFTAFAASGGSFSMIPDAPSTGNKEE